jgi:hypothetical protein
MLSLAASGAIRNLGAQATTIRKFLFFRILSGLVERRVA